MPWTHCGAHFAGVRTHPAERDDVREGLLAGHLIIHPGELTEQLVDLDVERELVGKRGDGGPATVGLGGENALRVEGGEHRHEHLGLAAALLV